MNKIYRVLAYYPVGHIAYGLEAKCKYYGDKNKANKLYDRLKHFTKLNIQFEEF